MAKGGNGGFGNAHFKSSTNRAPRRANPGLEGEEKWIWLRLKLIADIGIVGLPNAGKSTLLARVTAAKPKIADYPFTTLYPNLGVVRHKGVEFVLADIPGLIEGAHEGAGIGDRFLGHVERCRALIHLVDAAGEDPGAAYETVREELAAYGHGLAEKREIAVLSRADVATPRATEIRQGQAPPPRRTRAADDSAATGQGIEALLDACLELVGKSRLKRPPIRAGARREARRDSASAIADHRRIVVKVGSSLLVDGASGRLDRVWLASLAEDIAALVAEDRQVLVVSSGAIALGRGALGLGRGALKLEEAQAAAASGQIALAGAWAACLDERGLQAAQILLTLGDTEERRRYLNARATLATLLKMRAVPVINENDTVATAEIRYGDNDRLAARVAAMAGADCLVLLSDVDGLYTAPPASDSSAEFIDFVPAITPEIEAMAGAAGSELSRGGMKTKIEAGKIATAAGAAMVIASGAATEPARRDRCRRTRHLVRAAVDPGKRAQGLDCRPPGAARHGRRRCRCGSGAEIRQEPAASRCRRRSQVPLRAATPF